MKAIAIVSSLILASVAMTRADVTITWNSYSATSFDVLISGNGSLPIDRIAGGWSGTTTSPNGLWSLNTMNLFGLDAFPGKVDISNTGYMTNNGTVYGYANPDNTGPVTAYMNAVERTQGYSDVLPYNVLPVNDGTMWNQSFSSPWLLWTGFNTIQITSMPNVNDPSTWNFNAHYVGTVVPEPATASLAFVMLGGFAATTLRRRVR
jgi:hypothetical protein